MGQFMRRLVLAFFATILSGGLAAAGDYADRFIIGFSPDGAYFAFEEYGVQDGSGFPYSSIYVIETASDTWVEGTPVHIRLDDDTATLETARNAAYVQAEAVLQEFSIGIPGRLLLSNPITEITNSRQVEFLLRAYTPLQPTGWTLTLQERVLPTECPSLGYLIVGFGLLMKSPTNETTTLNNDQRIPESRGCPVAYGVSDIVAFDRPGDTVLIILLNMFKIGFEGPDRRFLALATTISE
jgi:predicted secreted protein